uniref:Uncharacterized protein n=1 Tax=Mycobacterium riyadhense TaxID=486698 RepID=A0A653EWS8_9MYCO|nr:hypothetical protein BIN_B_04192 [Mycobacterium riyadhense]
MPRYSPATRILRDDLLAQLRSATRPLSTSELREHAPNVPMPRMAHAVVPVSEQVYRILCALHKQGLVTRAGAKGRDATWDAAPTGADAEIAALEAMLSLSADTAQPLTTVEHAANHLTAAARTAYAAAAHDHTAASTALGHLLAQWADILTTELATPDHPAPSAASSTQTRNTAPRPDGLLWRASTSAPQPKHNTGHR